MFGWVGLVGQWGHGPWTVDSRNAKLYRYDRYVCVKILKNVGKNSQLHLI